MSGHWGIPGPGGSMGRCAVCGDTFIGGVVKDLMGMESGIESFSVGFIEQTLYCHVPKCKETLIEAFTAAQREPEGDEQAIAFRDALPDESPMRNVIDDFLKEKEA